MPILRRWSPGGQGKILVASSSVGMLVIAGRDPWSRFAELQPYDFILGQARDLTQVLMFERLRGDELAAVVRSICRSLPSVAWPLRGRSACRVGLLDRNNEFAAEADTLPRLGKRVDLKGEHLRTAWLIGRTYGGYRIIARPPVACADCDAETDCASCDYRTTAPATRRALFP